MGECPGKQTLGIPRTG